MELVFVSADGWFITAAHVIINPSDGTVGSDVNECWLTKEMHISIGFGAMCQFVDVDTVESSFDFAILVNRRIEVAAFELCRCLEQVDAIVSPTTPQAAPAFGGPPNDNAGAFCILANFAGTPAISVPMGFDEAGLPLGLQIIGALHHDAQVLQIAASYEAAAGLAMEPRPPSGSQA